MLGYALIMLLTPPIATAETSAIVPSVPPEVAPSVVPAVAPVTAPPIAPPVAPSFGPPAPKTDIYPDPRPPKIGLSGSELDACGGIGRIGGPLRKIEVYDNPHEEAREVDKLTRSTMVWLCEADGDWQGIVYASGKFQDISDCRVSSPVDEPKPYDGPCQAGWVQGKDVDLLAG